MSVPLICLSHASLHAVLCWGHHQGQETDVGWVGQAFLAVMCVVGGGCWGWGEGLVETLHVQMDPTGIEQKGVKEVGTGLHIVAQRKLFKLCF